MNLNVNLNVDITNALEEIEALQGAFEECWELLALVTSDEFKSDIHMAVAALILAEHLGYATKGDLASAVRLLEFTRGNPNGKTE